MKLLMVALNLLVHLLMSPVTLALSAGLVLGTWLICRQVSSRDFSGELPLATSEWLGA